MNSRLNQFGFTLFELALVLAIVGMLLGGVALPLVSARENLDRKLTRDQLSRLEQVLIGHLLTHGRLPCAASVDSDGLELSTENGCTLYAGFLPAASLGVQGQLSAGGLLLDRWNRPFRYRVSEADSDGDGRVDFVTADGFALQRAPAVRADNRVLRAVDADCGMPSPRAEAVVVVVLSEGLGSSRSEAERENLDDDSDFVSQAPSDIDGCAFDDQLLWLTENRLLTVLLEVGALPR